MYRRACQYLAAMLVFAGSASPAFAGDGLTLFGTVTGQCFTGDVGEGARDTHCFAPIFGGKHLRDSHRVILDGKIVYSGETIYSVEAGQVTFTYVNSLGGVGRGSAKAAPGGIAFTGTMRASPAARMQSMNSHWLWRKGGGYEAAAPGQPAVNFKPSCGTAPCRQP